MHITSIIDTLISDTKNTFYLTYKLKHMSNNRIKDRKIGHRRKNDPK